MKVLDELLKHSLKLVKYCLLSLYKLDRWSAARQGLCLVAYTEWRKTHFLTNRRETDATLQFQDGAI